RRRVSGEHQNRRWRGGGARGVSLSRAATGCRHRRLEEEPVMNEQFPAADGQRAVFNDNMPRLSSGLSRGVNKMAVAYVVLVSLAVIGATLWITRSAFSADDKNMRVSFDEVEVPKKPEFRPAPPPPPPA